MAESWTSEATKSTTSINSLKELSGSELLPEKPATVALPKITAAIRALIPDSLPGYIRKMRGFLATMEAINAYCEDHQLPRFWDGGEVDLNKYRVTLGKPSGVPLSFPVTVFRRNPDGDDQPLDQAFRITR